MIIYNCVIKEIVVVFFNGMFFLLEVWRMILFFLLIIDFLFCVILIIGIFCCFVKLVKVFVFLFVLELEIIIKILGFFVEFNMEVNKWWFNVVNIVWFNCVNFW